MPPKNSIGNFWKRINKNGPAYKNLGRCWIYGGADDGSGYGTFGIAGRIHRTHRLSWTISIGEVPVGLCVLHKCDNRRCVNPNHLFLGTRVDNNKDRHAKGREKPCKGSTNGRAKITEEQAVEIRSLQRSGWTYTQLMVKYGLSKSMIGNIVQGKAWRHVS